MPLAWSQKIFLRAPCFAAKAHNNQLVPGTELPYIVHQDQICMEICTALTVEPITDPNLAVQCALRSDPT